MLIKGIHVLNPVKPGPHTYSQPLLCHDYICRYVKSSASTVQLPNSGRTIFFVDETNRWRQYTNGINTTRGNIWHNRAARRCKKLSFSSDCIPWCHHMETFSTLLGIYAGTLMFSLICAWMNGWVNNREAGDLKRHRAHYYVIVMIYPVSIKLYFNTGCGIKGNRAQSDNRYVLFTLDVHTNGNANEFNQTYGRFNWLALESIFTLS